MKSNLLIINWFPNAATMKAYNDFQEELAEKVLLGLGIERDQIVWHATAVLESIRSKGVELFL